MRGGMMAPPGFQGMMHGMRGGMTHAMPRHGAPGMPYHAQQMGGQAGGLQPMHAQHGMAGYSPQHGMVPQGSQQMGFSNSARHGPALAAGLQQPHANAPAALSHPHSAALPPSAQQLAIIEQLAPMIAKLGDQFILQLQVGCYRVGREACLVALV